MDTVRHEISCPVGLNGSVVQASKVELGWAGLISGYWTRTSIKVGRSRLQLVCLGCQALVIKPLEAITEPSVRKEKGDRKSVQSNTRSGDESKRRQLTRARVNMNTSQEHTHTYRIVSAVAALMQYAVCTVSVYNVGAWTGHTPSNPLLLCGIHRELPARFRSFSRFDSLPVCLLSAAAILSCSFRLFVFGFFIFFKARACACCCARRDWSAGERVRRPNEPD